MKPSTRLLLVILIGLALVAGGFWAGRAATAGDTDPGTAADPLVAKSYFDQFTRLVIVNLTAGQTLELEAGTEIILRVGQATVIDSYYGGLADLTAGKDLRQGTVVPANHLLLTPRSDGRGIKAVTDCIIMVRGPYIIK